jgi:Rrf2 family protein
MLLSQTTEYAVRAVLFIAARHPSTVRASELADSLELPRNYLGKTLGALARAGLLLSTRGPAGGFRLSRPPSAITLSDVTRSFAPPAPRRCLLGLGPCGQNPDCPVHHRWLPSAQLIDRFFDSTTVADLVASPMQHSPTGGAAALVDHPLLQVS